MGRSERDTGVCTETFRRSFALGALCPTALVAHHARSEKRRLCSVRATGIDRPSRTHRCSVMTVTLHRVVAFQDACAPP